MQEYANTHFIEKPKQPTNNCFAMKSFKWNFHQHQQKQQTYTDKISYMNYHHDTNDPYL
jgi:hypothetical protein